MLTNNQKTALAAAIRAETNQGVIDAVAIGNITYLVEWCNGLSATDAWADVVEKSTLFEATNIAKFDNLTAGKRDAWQLVIDNAPIDGSRNKMRSAVVDIWGTSDSVAILQDMRRKATRGEAYLGGSSATTNTVTALKLKYVGGLSIDDIATALNENP